MSTTLNHIRLQPLERGFRHRIPRTLSHIRIVLEVKGDVVAPFLEVVHDNLESGRCRIVLVDWHTGMGILASAGEVGMNISNGDTGDGDGTAAASLGFDAAA